MSDNTQNGKENGSSSLLDVLDSMLGPDAERLVRENEDKLKAEEKPVITAPEKTPAADKVKTFEAEAEKGSEKKVENEILKETDEEPENVSARVPAQAKEKGVLKTIVAFVSSVLKRISTKKISIKKLFEPRLPQIKRTPLEEEMRNAVEQTILDNAFYKEDRPIDASEDLFDAIERNLEKVSRVSYDQALLAQGTPNENKSSKVRFAPNKKKKTWPKVVLGVFSTLVVFNLFLFFTVPGHRIVKKMMSSGYRVAAHFIVSQIEVDDPTQWQDQGNIDPSIYSDDPDYNEAGTTPTPLILPDITPDAGTQVTDPNMPPMPTPVPTAFPEDSSVINVLLIGEECIDGTRRSDTMLIASIDKDGGPLKLVSLMRDLYVQIPPTYVGGNYTEYSHQKLNAAYHFGGAPLLMDTIELNFGIHCDAYVIVGFDGFISLIDYLGGVEITLSEEEAIYLNTSNYIPGNSSKRCTNPVEAGTHLVDGKRALGYCRVRYVPTYTGLNGDYGRTFRQREVLSYIFNKVKSLNLIEVYGLMKDCLKYVKVSSDFEKIASECLETVFEKHMFELDTYRIPLAGEYFGDTWLNGSAVLFEDVEIHINGNAYLYGDLSKPSMKGFLEQNFNDANAVALYGFLYGSDMQTNYPNLFYMLYPNGMPQGNDTYKVYFNEKPFPHYNTNAVALYEFLYKNKKTGTDLQ